MTDKLNGLLFGCCVRLLSGRNLISFLASSMRNKQLLICFLLGYLVLLWNLGPSFHRADFLGFSLCPHAQVQSTSFGDELASGHSCCPCHGHSHSKPRPSDGQQSDTTSSFGSHHDCAFCQFFDQLHIMASVAELTEAESRVFLSSTVDLIRVTAAALPASARGPPSTC